MKKIEIKKELVIDLVFMFILMGSSFYLGMQKDNVKTSINKVKAGAIKPIITDINDSKYIIDNIYYECNNSSFERTVNCVVMNTLPYYKYIDHNDTIVKSPEETLKDGGICTDWSSYYCYLFENLGFDCKTIVTPSVTHMVAMVSIDNAYCIVDQNQYKCWSLGNG